MSDGLTTWGRVRAFLSYPLPPGVGWSHVTGGVLLTLFLVQALTGGLMATVYSPSAAEAWDSVRYIDQHVDGGALVRGIHHWAASAFLPVAVLHMAHAFFTGAYKGRRKLVWLSGCVLLFCVFGFGFTGYLLPWDLKAFFGTRVGVEIAGSTPLFGEELKRLLAGGPAVGPLTLPRFYAVHAVILPVVTTFAILVHVAIMRKAGIAPHWRAEEGAVTTRLFHPHQTFRDAVASLLVIALIVGVAWKLGAPLDERADPQNSTYVPRPEWYFLGLQQLLRIFQGDNEVIGTFWIPAVSVTLLVLLPWLDLNRSRDPRTRWFALPLGGLAALAIAVLTIWGAVEIKREERAMEARVESRAIAAAEAAPDEDPPSEPLDETALVELGAGLYAALQCAACHAEFTPAWERGTPTLELQGSRATRKWNREYLLNPTRIRRDEASLDGAFPALRMPDYDLTEEEADALAAHLATLVDEERVPAVDWRATATLEELAEGERLFTDLCASCHLLAGEGEPYGPDLDVVAARRTPAYMEAVIRDPEGVLPGTTMTDFQLEPEEARAISRWLAERN